MGYNISQIKHLKFFKLENNAALKMSSRGLSVPVLWSQGFTNHIITSTTACHLGMGGASRLAHKCALPAQLSDGRRDLNFRTNSKHTSRPICLGLPAHSQPSLVALTGSSLYLLICTIIYLQELFLSLLSPLTKSDGAGEAKKLASPALTGSVRGEMRKKKNSYEQCMNNKCVRETETDRSSTNQGLTIPFDHNEAASQVLQSC